jgi:hypothetical protein
MMEYATIPIAIIPRAITITTSTISQAGKMYSMVHPLIRVHILATLAPRRYCLAGIRMTQKSKRDLGGMSVHPLHKISDEYARTNEGNACNPDQYGWKLPN